MGGTPTPADNQTDRPPFVVGVGASAGGLEALQKLFENTRRTGGFAFVVIQHLSPDFESVMGELLDGFGVATRVRKEAPGVVRLVALTGYGLPHDRARVTDAGFDRHILKPVEPSALFRVLREVSPNPTGAS